MSVGCRLRACIARAPLGFAGLLAVATAVQGQDWSQVRIRTVPLAENVHVLVGGGGHILLLTGDDGALLVDSGYEQVAEQVIAAARAVRDVPIRYVVNTHWHFDHTGGNQALSRGGAVIVAHANVRRCMETERHIDHIDHTQPAARAAALPTITFSDSMTLHVADECVQLLHVDPAHTDGDTLVYLKKANVLHIGDVGFMGQYPFIDIAAGGSIDGMIAAVDRALSLVNAETQVVSRARAAAGVGRSACVSTDVGCESR